MTTGIRKQRFDVKNPCLRVNISILLVTLLHHAVEYAEICDLPIVISESNKYSFGANTVRLNV